MFKIGLSGQMFDDRSIWDHLEAAAKYGYDTVELRSTHLNPGTSPDTLNEIKDFLSRKNISVNGLSCFTGNYALLDEDGCETAFEIFKKYVDIASFMSARSVRVWPGWIESCKADDDTFRKAAKWMQISADYAKEKGILLFMEMHHGTLCDKADASLRLLELIDRDNVGLTLDPVNLYQVPENYTHETITKLKKYIFNVHIKDIVKLDTGCHPYCFEYGFYAKHIGRFTPVHFEEREEKQYFTHRRILQGGVDWHGVISALEEIGYDGAIVVESVQEGNKFLPSGANLAKACMDDVKELLMGAKTNRNWKKYSHSHSGLYTVVSPKDGECQEVTMLRLNLKKGEKYTLSDEALEMNCLVTKGKVSLSGAISDNLDYLDSFYMPACTEVEVSAIDDCSLYVGAAKCEGYGKPFVRKMDMSLPLGDIHQIHGEGSGSREVMFTLAPQDAASRLICGVTWSGDGAWTSWKPHQHENDLEEVYCYFDTEKGLHYSYNTDESFADATAYVITDGDMVIAPKGYHPTCAIPDSKNTYFWVLAARSHSQRRYDLAVTDPTI